MSAWEWTDAYVHDLSARDGANRALRLELSASRHFPPEIWVPTAFHVATGMERAGWWWQARTLRAHAARKARDVWRRAP